MALKFPVKLLVNALGPPPKDVIDEAQGLVTPAALYTILLVRHFEHQEIVLENGATFSGPLMARALAGEVREREDFELLAEPGLSIVNFRFHPPGGILTEAALDRLNRRIASHLVATGTFPVDDGRLTLTLTSPVPMLAGETRTAVTVFVCTSIAMSDANASARFSASLFMALVFRQPWHAEIAPWAQRT